MYRLYMYVCFLQKPLMDTEIVTKFSEFHEKWTIQLGECYEMLTKQSLDSDSNIQVLVDKVVAHHKEYYAVKWAAAHKSVFPFFTPTWLTPMEIGNLWYTGWKPSTAFCILDLLNRNNGSYLSNLNDDQLEKIRQLRMNVQSDEAKVESNMERQQVVIADHEMYTLVMKGSEVDMEVGVKRLLNGLEKVMKLADYARLKTLKLVLEILDPKQSVEFLAGMAKVQIGFRVWRKITHENDTSHASSSA